MSPARYRVGSPGSFQRLSAARPAKRVSSTSNGEPAGMWRKAAPVHGRGWALSTGAAPADQARPLGGRALVIGGQRAEDPFGLTAFQQLQGRQAAERRQGGAHELAEALRGVDQQAEIHDL